MNEIDLLVSMLLLGVVFGLGIAYLQSRIDKSIWNYVRMLCGIAGAISIMFFVYFGYMVWYGIGVAFLFVVLYEPHKGNKYLFRGLLRRREEYVPRSRRPYSRREEEPQLEEWL